MKKLFLLAVLAGSAVFVKAQDIDEIRNLVLLGQVTKAKESLDKYLSSEKNAKKPEGWYWKAYITNQLSKDSLKTVQESSAMKMEAFDLFKKYRQMDPKAPLLVEDNYTPIYDLYAGFGSELAIKAYQAKDFDASYDNFKKAVDVHDYSITNNFVFNNGYKFPELDTLFIQYTAIAAVDAKKPDEAVVYHKKLVDAGLSGDTYADSYNFLVDYYKKKNDKTAFYEVLNKAKKFYPNNARYWTALEVELETEGIPKPDVFKKYAELVTANPGNYDVAYNYAAELFNYINSDDSKGVDLTEYKANLKDVLQKSIAIKSTFEANFVMTVSQYNNSFDLTDEATKIKSVKPDDQKKKKALQAESTKALDDAIPYGEAAMIAFKDIAKPSGTEKGNYRKLLTMMKNIYEVKKNPAKIAEYEALIKASM
ncbi:MAG TPA: hypothetical protein PLY34_15755 [Ferruginibacter sp.]|nr:hypothetical protein [Ferruginibacter sp.]HPH92619.1 hypothetical protein [Ferruginibacter sp.]